MYGPKLNGEIDLRKPKSKKASVESDPTLYQVGALPIYRKTNEKSEIP